VTTIVEARCLLRGGGGISNVPSNENFIKNSSNHHYRNKLVDVPIDIQASSLLVGVVKYHWMLFLLHNNNITT
jgi:hypothetical protein